MMKAKKISLYSEVIFVRGPFGRVQVNHGLSSVPVVTVRTTSDKPQVFWIEQEGEGAVSLNSYGKSDPIRVPKWLGSLAAWLGFCKKYEITCSASQ